MASSGQQCFPKCALTVTIQRIRNGKTHCAYTGSYNSLQGVGPDVVGRARSGPRFQLP